MVVLEVNVACLGERQQCQNLIGMLPYFAELGVEILYFLPIQKMGKVKAKGSPYCLCTVIWPRRVSASSKHGISS